MKIKIIAIGKIKEKYLHEGIYEYEKRLKGLETQLKILELPETQGDSAKCIKEESAKILEKISGEFIALDPRGKCVSSEELARITQKFEPIGETTIIIGGSHGLSEEIKNQAKFLVSFGKITLPHQLCRLIACEQIYRAISINRGKKYHK